MYWTLKSITHALLPLIVKLEVEGEDNIPPHGPYIMATNHLSVFDTAVIMDVCPHKVRALAADKHRCNPVYAPLLLMAGCIWVKRGEVDRHALQEALNVLEQGGVMGLAPEGTRAREEYALQRGKRGTAYLAARAGVPILPIGLAGTEKIKENLPRLRRTQVAVRVGEPFQLPVSGRVGRPKLREYTDAIMYKIAELLPEEYRGVYAE